MLPANWPKLLLLELLLLELLLLLQVLLLQVLLLQLLCVLCDIKQFYAQIETDNCRWGT